MTFGIMKDRKKSNHKNRKLPLTAVLSKWGYGQNWNSFLYIWLSDKKQTKGAKIPTCKKPAGRHQHQNLPTKPFPNHFSDGNKTDIF